MEKIALAAKPRTVFGTRATRRIRRTGVVPAILYGHGMKPLSLEIAARELERAFHTKAGENVLIDLKVDGVRLKESTCLAKQIQHDPVTDQVSHIDFTVISLTEEIEVKVPLVTMHSGEAVGVKEGGILDVVHHEIEIRCLPTAIPQKIEVDVKGMKIGDTILAKDLPIPPGVTCKLGPEEVIVSLHPPMKEEAPAEEAAAPAEPEVIEKGKKPEEGEEAPAAAPQEKKPTGEKKPAGEKKEAKP